MIKRVIGFKSVVCLAIIPRSFPRSWTSWPIKLVASTSTLRRGPDVLPSRAKKDTGMGVTNAREAVKGFTIATVVATHVPALQGMENVSRVVKVTGAIRA